MKDEIKEILKMVEECSKYVDKEKANLKLNEISCKHLLDYITTLQEENETLKELNVCVGCNNNPDYKTRIDKAIEYIEENITSFRKIELLNILQGDDNNE